MTDARDLELGLDRKIDRRDFLNGVALAGAGLLSPRTLLGLHLEEDFAPEQAASYYPPALTGPRGSTDGTFEAAHAIRDHTLKMETPVETGESYDLVVVGAGISGLSAAHFYRKAAAVSYTHLTLPTILRV